jgi:hypothetical protein
MLDQRGHLDGQGKWPRKQTPSTSNPEETVKRLETKPYGKRVNRGHELTFEKYLDGKATGKNIRKPRVPAFRKKDAQVKPQQITKKIKRDSTALDLNKDNVRSFIFFEKFSLGPPKNFHPLKPERSDLYKTLKASGSKTKTTLGQFLKPRVGTWSTEWTS